MIIFQNFLAVKYANLVLWLKVYVAFNDLHILKILSEWKWMKVNEK